MGNVEQHSMYDEKSRTANDSEYADELDRYYKGSIGSDIDKLRNFPKYVPRQNMSTFLAKNELFKRILNVHGNIVECGVFLGAGVMTWANLSAIYEPYNHTRRVIGFDTFSGFAKINPNDKSASNTDYAKEGGLAVDSFSDINECVGLYDKNRPIGHIPRVELVKGDANETIPSYVATNKHLVVSMLYLDFDLYEPTKTALECFLPLMPKGSIVAFDELNQEAWPGETQAVREIVGLDKLRIERFTFESSLSYAVIE